MLRNSIKYKIIFTVIIIILPFVLIVNYSNIYSLGLIRHQIAQASVSTTSLYIGQVDKNIKEIESYLFGLSAVNKNAVDTNIVDLNSSDDGKRFYANYFLAQQIQSDIALYNITSFLFIYTKCYDSYLYAYSNDSTYYERQELKKYTEAEFAKEPGRIGSKWTIVSIDGQNYLLRVVKQNDVYIGAFINFNEIAKPLDSISNKYKGSFIFADLNGRPLTNSQFVNSNTINLNGNLNTYYVSGKTKKFVIAGGKSNAGDFKLLLAIPDSNILQGLNSIQYFILVISILAILILPFLLLAIYLWILKPMGKMKTAIREIENGNLDYRISDEKVSREFMDLYNAFNSMTGQIKALKISVYEEIIEKQKLELRYYQTQIKPHFLMNALTTVSNFAQMGSYKSMQEFICCLSNHIRYTFRSNLTLVPLKDEIDNVNNYLSMQELRFSGYLSHYTDIDDKTKEIMIPPFTVQTFVENIIKHAITFSNTVNVFIKTEPTEIENHSYVRIVVEDDGKGMTQEAVEQINNDRRSRDDGKSIGIWNIKQTLNLIYSGRARVIVSKSELAGTMIEIVLPAAR